MITKYPSNLGLLAQTIRATTRIIRLSSHTFYKHQHYHFHLPISKKISHILLQFIKMHTSLYKHQHFLIIQAVFYLQRIPNVLLIIPTVFDFN